ncbi:hypothetical protein OE88DRAFT_1652197 [Heliocybe sulcata]|uniref:WIBG Mago-binding domain-containing protein n=1 Tax=Heliocybe sulcata TaxID=5364 RepID=A0A5C3NFK5_9AGAM|nr:hypothetical protein OE88DRAFT_1652197 [Heliocybe sulcata]
MARTSSPSGQRSLLYSHLPSRSLLSSCNTQSVRKELKVRPGFTPQEDVKRFRGTRQAQMDAHQLPKGQILGWVAPSSASTSKPKAAAATEGQSALSKSAAKNAKRSAKKKAQKEQEHLEKIRDNWESSEEEKPATPKAAAKGKESEGGSNTGDKPDATSEAEALAEELDKLEVK